MEFKVPGSVLNQISEYDPVKPNVRKTSKGSTRNTLGLVNDLFPANIVPVETQNDWAIQINRLSDRERVKALDTTTSHAILYTNRAGWMALWHTKPGHVDHGKYVFGMSVAYKCTDRALSIFGEHGSPLLDGTEKTLESIFPHKTVKYGRVAMRKHTGVFTTSDIVDLDLYGLPVFNQYSGYSSSKYNALGCFVKTLSSTIPVWENNLRYGGCKNIFKRIQCEKYPIKSLRFCSEAVNLSFQGDLKEQFKDSVCGLFPSISNMMSTPYFCRETSNLVNALTEALTGVHDHEVQNLVLNYVRSCRSVSDFILLYGEEANPDYCQRIWKSYKRFCLEWSDPVKEHNFSDLPLNLVFSWIRENVPVSSMVNMVERAENSQLVDALIMLGRFFKNAGKDAVLPKPKRWRASEFHDVVNEELYKIRNPNYSLPQDLFPSPVKVDNLTFFQPKDTHQLGKWGQTVRNCVGNSSQYAEGVKKKSKFIVLALDNGKPHFTIELSVKDSVMRVMQIVKQSNKSLTEEESVDYAEKFSRALEIREKELTA